MRTHTEKKASSIKGNCHRPIGLEACIGAPINNLEECFIIFFFMWIHHLTTVISRKEAGGDHGYGRGTHAYHKYGSSDQKQNGSHYFSCC